MTTYVQSALNKLETPSGAIGEAPDPAGDLLHLRDQIDARLGTGGAERVATSAELAAIPTSRCFAGKLAYQVDADILYRHNGSAWKGWASTWRTYAPNVAGMPSGSTTGGTYRFVVGDIEFVAGATSGGTGGTGDLQISLPANYPAGTPRFASFAPSNITRPSVNTWQTTWNLSGAGPSNLIRCFVQRVDGTYSTQAVANNGIPIAWAAGDTVQAYGIYTPA